MSEGHRQIIGVRGGKIGLSGGRRNGSDPQDVSHICRFGLPASPVHPEVTGDVVAIPLTPEDLLSEQERAVLLMHRAVKVAERTGPPVDVVGLGSLCAVVGRRGQALQERLQIPVTTGGAATVWTIFANAIQANPHRETIGVIGSGSPVGKALIKLLHQHKVPLSVDSRKSTKGIIKNETPMVVQDAETIARTAKWIIGCGPTGPAFSESLLSSGATVLDVALPHTFSPAVSPRKDIRTFFAERMTMPNTWNRGLWGRVYHMVSGYGYRTVLACLVEPVVMAAFGQGDPYAQGRRIQTESVLDFGQKASELGFHASLSSDFWWGTG